MLNYRLIFFLLLFFISHFASATFNMYEIGKIFLHHQRCFHYSQIYYIWWLLLSLKIIFIFRVYAEEVLTLLFEFSYVCALCRFVCQLLSFKHSEQLIFTRSFIIVRYVYANEQRVRTKIHSWIHGAERQQRRMCVCERERKNMRANISKKNIFSLKTIHLSSAGAKPTKCKKTIKKRNENQKRRLRRCRWNGHTTANVITCEIMII